VAVVVGLLAAHFYEVKMVALAVAQMAVLVQEQIGQMMLV
jgi:hypothetical protein